MATNLLVQPTWQPRSWGNPGKYLASEKQNAPELCSFEAFCSSFRHLTADAMTLSKQAIIDRTIKAINLLPADKGEEIFDFADFVSKRYEEQQLAQGTQKLAAKSQAFAFLHDEENLYTEAELKKVCS
jgi:hypothetical protein